MATWRKETKPVDRALDEVNEQIATLERQLRAANSHSAANPAAANRVATMKSFVKEMLTPPAKQPSSAPYRASRGLPDVETNPMSDLEADAIPFVRQHEPDLFSHAKQPALAGVADDTLGKLLAAGSLRPPKPTLKRVQRETRNRFFMWLGLSFVALWVIYAVVR